LSSFARKHRRKKEKDAQKDFKKKVGLFDKLPDHCLVCQKDFDKKDKEMVMSWNVVVHKEKEVVRLYCPTCWDEAGKIIKDIKNGQQNAKVNV